jgi:hypothetical protein
MSDMSASLIQEMFMSAFSIMAVIGLACLVVGVFLVNVVSTPRAALVGTIIAGFGVVTLAVVAVRQVLAMG